MSVVLTTDNKLAVVIIDELGEILEKITLKSYMKRDT